MSSDSNPKKDWLAKRAEELLSSKEKLNPADFSNSLEELVESLQIYQIELELQNAELIRVQQSLDRQKSRFEALFNHAPIGYFSLTLDGELIEANKECYRILSTTSETIKGKQFNYFVHPDSQDEYYFHLKRVKEIKTEHSTILRIGNSAIALYVKLHSTITHFENDDREVLLCTISDITNEVTYQRDLHQSEERFRSLVTSIDDVVFTLDLNQRHTGVYGRWLERFNQTPDDYLGKTSADMMGQELAQIHEKHNHIALKGQSVVYEWSIDSIEGKQYFQTSLSPIFGPNREVVGLAGVARNISDLKKAEQALAEKELQYRTLADSGQSLSWASGIDMKWTYFTQVKLDFTGKKLEQQLGDGWIEGVHPDDLDRCVSIYKNAFNNREKFSMAYRLRHFTGDYRWIQDDGTPNYNSNGEFIGYIGHCLDISERARIEEELRISEEKYRVIFDSAPVGIFHYNLNGIITACNDTFVSIIGSSSKTKLIGLNVLNLPNADVVSAIMRSLQGEKAYFEGFYSPITAEKSLFVKAHIEPMHLKEGNISGGIAIVEDITQQKVAEDALRDSEEKFRTLVESANDIIYTVSPQGEFTFVSPNWQNILGHELKEVIGKSLATFVHPDDVILCKSFLKKVLETEKPQSGVEYRALHKDGKWRWHRSNGSVRKLKDNAVEYVGVAHDITALKHAESSLIERMKEINCLYYISSLGHKTDISVKHYLHQVVNSIPSGFKDPQGTAARIILGDYSVQTNNFSNSSNRLDSEIRVTDKPIGSVEVVLLQKPTEIDIPFLDEEQTLIDLIADNIVQVFERENILKEVNRKNTALQELNAEKDKILTIIAHDLRSPLSTIIGLAGLLESKHGELEPDKELRLLEGVSQTANRLFQLLENLLDWARLKRGKIDFSPQNENLRELAERAAGIFENQAEAKNLQLSININPGIAIFADANMVQTIIRNLLSNAIKFSHRDGQIAIDAKNIDNQWVEVTVTDAGVGMEAKILEKLFRIDSEAGRQGTEEEPSSGFGLPLCKELVEKNGGTIWAESKEDMGSKFCFTLPSKPISKA